MPALETVTALARRQHGTVTRSQLEELGFSPGRIRGLLDRGVLERAAPGIYVVAGSEDSWRRRLRVALHRGGPPSVVSHRAAAGLWSLDRFRPGHVDIASPWSGARSGTDARLHRSVELPPRDRTTVDGLPVTTPTRTLVDLGRYLGALRLRSMMDDAVRRQLTSYEALHRRLGELARPGRRGVQVVREALATRPGGSVPPGSPFEAAVHDLLVRAGLPTPTLQHPVPCDDVTYVLDLAWPEVLVAVECDGFRFHCTPDQLDHDDRRRTRLAQRGWLLHHVTWAGLRADPDELERDVRRSLELRSR